MKIIGKTFFCASMTVMTVLIILLLVTPSASAKMSDCKQPITGGEVILNPVPYKGNPVGMLFCEIPAANSILIGSKKNNDERPVKGRNFHSFQLAQYTVTQLQYKTVMGGEPWKGKEDVKEGDNNPAVYVSYEDAKEFVKRASIIDKTATWRLPTEAEWEYAARAGTTTEYYWGEKFDERYAYSSLYVNRTGEAFAHKVDSCPVKDFDCSNQFGLMHMLGNVWQWTADAYVSSYENAPIDGNAAVIGSEGSSRVIRGGGWGGNADDCRAAGRNGLWPDYRDFFVGFRPVRTPK